MQKADDHTHLTPSKNEPPLATLVAAPVTPATAPPPNSFYPPTAQITSHSNPNTPVNQRTQRHNNQPKFSTPQPGRHQNQGWNPPHNQNYHQGYSGHHGGQQNNPWPDTTNTQNNSGRGYNNYHRQNTYPQQRGGNQRGGQ